MVVLCCSTGHKISECDRSQSMTMASTGLAGHGSLSLTLSLSPSIRGVLGRKADNARKKESVFPDWLKLFRLSRIVS